jgi:hypothetical protein
VNKGPKLLARQPQPEIFQHDQGPHIPTVSGISEREQLARPPRRLPEQRLSVRVAANHTVERHHVGVVQGACDHGEVAHDKLVGRDPYCDPASRRATSK